MDRTSQLISQNFNQFKVKGKKSKQKRVLYLGSLIESKGPQVLLQALREMKNYKCRFCSCKISDVFVDLGTSPLSNAFLKDENIDGSEKVFPLKVFVCKNCFLIWKNLYLKLVDHLLLGGEHTQKICDGFNTPIMNDLLVCLISYLVSFFNQFRSY